MAEARIFRFMEERDAIIREVADLVVREKIREAEASPARALEYVLNEVAFLEMQRLEKGSSKLDLRPYGYWSHLARTVGRASEAEKERILRELVGEYARDVAGKFTPWVYRFTSRILPKGLNLLFNAQDPQHLFRDFKGLADRILLMGEVDRWRRLAELGTLVVVPTHSSNLDSIVVGYALDAAGLPPATYGAGKNLFTNPITSFFMHNLGAYKVDRRIKHSLYKDVLKTYSEVLLQRGYHSLFFPGGTRSRSNHVETKLKLGLLGSALTAYTHNVLEKRPSPRIFICPLTINYHLILEGETLIDDYLRTDGAHRYIIEDDEFSDVAKVLRFVMNTMKMEYTLYLRFAPPLDPFGNPVDDDGASLDPRGRAIETERYLWQDGEVRPDPARDAEYTRACGQAVARAFRENTVVVSPAFVAFLVFRHLAAEYRDLDLYRLLRVARGETVPWTDLEPRAERLRQALVDLSRAGKIHLAPDVASRSVRELLDKGTGVLGTFHTTPVLTRRPEGIAVTQPNLLYFYSNRLAGYGLEGLS